MKAPAPNSGPRPLILVSPDIDTAGKEFHDLSISLSAKYQESVLAAGGLPLTLPATVSAEVLGECVARADGVLLTGGDDVEPALYGAKLPPDIRSTVGTTRDGGRRDLRELLLIQQVFAQRKPLLAICRGHQVLNVALGGTLVADIPRMLPGAANHRRDDKRNDIAHEVRLTPGSLLSRITATQELGVNSTHHQAVARVAPPFCVVARSPDGVVESLELKPGARQALPFLLSVQFHPERLADRFEAHAAIFRAFVEACVRSRKHVL